MESPITPEELQAEIRATFKAAKRREIAGLLILLVGLLLILFVGVGFIWTEFGPTSPGGARHEPAGALHEEPAH